jgi:hypothetical protein
MKKILIMQVLATALLTGACSEDHADPTTIPETTATVRFFNATTGMTESGGFTTNGQFTSGSALGFGQASQTCSTVDAGPTSFAFGATNSGGTALSGNTLASLDNQTLTAGGSYTVVATGSATNPALFIFDNKLAWSLGATEAAVRFVNLAAGTDTVPNTYVVYKGPVGLGTIIGSNIAFGAATGFTIVQGGSNQFSVLKLPGHVIAVEGSAGVLDLSAGTVNTVAILPNSSGGLQLVNVSKCS